MNNWLNVLGCKNVANLAVLARRGCLLSWQKRVIKKWYIYEIMYLFTRCIVLALKNTFPLICVSKYFNGSFNHVQAWGHFFGEEIHTCSDG